VTAVAPAPPATPVEPAAPAPPLPPLPPWPATDGRTGTAVSTLHRHRRPDALTTVAAAHRPEPTPGVPIPLVLVPIPPVPPSPPAAPSPPPPPWPPKPPKPVAPCTDVEPSAPVPPFPPACPASRRRRNPLGSRARSRVGTRNPPRVSGRRRCHHCPPLSRFGGGLTPLGPVRTRCAVATGAAVTGIAQRRRRFRRRPHRCHRPHHRHHYRRGRHGHRFRPPRRQDRHRLTAIGPQQPTVATVLTRRAIQTVTGSTTHQDRSNPERATPGNGPSGTATAPAHAAMRWRPTGSGP